MHTYTLITGTERKKEGGRISFAQCLVLCILQRVEEIEIGVCFCSDMDEEPQSTDMGREGGS